MIRKMEPRDRDSVVDLALAFGKERLEPAMSIDREAAEAQFDQFILMPSVQAIVAEEDGVVVGMIVCFVSPMLFTSQVIGQEVVWYVKKEHRGQGLRLLKYMENLLKSLNCVAIMMVGLDVDVYRMYERLGYFEFQRSYFKRLV